MQTVGALMIGQTPRPDLAATLIDRLPAGCRVIEAGALDGLAAGALPPPVEGRYPLSTRLRDGTPVLVEEAFLTARLQEKLEQLERQGAAATVLLCAGTFAALRGNRPLFKPFALGRNLLHELGFRRPGLIAPLKEQEAPIRARWQAAGFAPTVWTADLNVQDHRFFQRLVEQIEVERLECLVLDYVGHPSAQVMQLQANAGIPVVDLGRLAVAALAAVL